MRQEPHFKLLKDGFWGIIEHIRPRRGAGAVQRGGLENRGSQDPREFESHPLRFY
jgi:hypothetical protein